METNDKLLKSFFSENKQEIADNGFTQGVMRNLPAQTDRSWIVWVFAAIGMAISLYFGLSTGLFQQLLLIFGKVSVYYLLAGVFCFPLVGTAGFYAVQNRNL
ncbi:MAG: DUF5056 domain-containing protein [Paludibacter sp.]